MGPACPGPDGPGQPLRSPSGFNRWENRLRQFRTGRWLAPGCERSRINDKSIDSGAELDGGHRPVRHCPQVVLATHPAEQPFAGPPRRLRRGGHHARRPRARSGRQGRAETEAAHAWRPEEAIVMEDPSAERKNWSPREQNPTSRARLSLLRLSALPRNLHSPWLGRQNHGSAGMPALQETHDRVGEAGG